MYLLSKTGSFSYEMNIDTDGDGLCDYVEKEILRTDYNKKDTDGDGLDDYSEVYEFRHSYIRKGCQLLQQWQLRKPHV